MSSAQYLREFVKERLTAAAEEIFGVFEKIIAAYEEEIDRQRRLLDVVWKPEIKLERIELPQKHVCKEEEVLTDQQLCIQERSCSLDQEEPEPPQIKEEQEELCSSQEGEQLLLKQETDAFMLIPHQEESDDSEDQTLNLSNNESVLEEKPQNYIFVQKYVAPEPNSDHQLLSHNSDESESQNQTGDKHGDSGSTKNLEPKQPNQHHKSKSHIENVSQPTMSVIRFNTHTGKKSFKCDTCGKAFPRSSNLKRHQITHTDEKPHACDTCGKRFCVKSSLNAHVRIHMGERPHRCHTCGKTFRGSNDLMDHIGTHRKANPSTCKICGRAFRDMSDLRKHLMTHTGEKPHACYTCGKRFRQKSTLNVHMRIHTGERPYSCNECGQDFRFRKQLTEHMRIHTGSESFT